MRATETGSAKATTAAAAPASSNLGLGKVVVAMGIVPATIALALCGMGTCSVAPQDRTIATLSPRGIVKRIFGIAKARSITEGTVELDQ